MDCLLNGKVLHALKFSNNIQSQLLLYVKEVKEVLFLGTVMEILLFGVQTCQNRNRLI